MTDNAKVNVAPASAKDTSGVTQVAVKGQRGEDLGFTIDLAPGGGDGDDAAALAQRVKGWTKFEVEGQPFRYSKQNARELLNRYPHIADQLRRA